MLKFRFYFIYCTSSVISSGFLQFWAIGLLVTHCSTIEAFPTTLSVIGGIISVPVNAIVPTIDDRISINWTSSLDEASSLHGMIKVTSSGDSIF